MRELREVAVCLGLRRRRRSLGVGGVQFETIQGDGELGNGNISTDRDESNGSTAMMMRLGL